MSKIKYGFCVPIFANPGMLFFRTPAFKKLDWNSIKNTTLLCEKLGYDSLFIADHLFLGKEGAVWECMTTMSALGALTNKMSIIPIHLCNNFRHPGVVAKALSTLSHITEGRVELFYDYGWRESEFNSYGIDFCKNENERVSKMAEGIEIIKGMLNNDKFSHQGNFYNIENAICNPKPYKKIPIWMGETNNPNMVTEIVKHADIFNSMPCSLESFDKKCNILKEECKKQNKNYKDIKLSLETQILIRETEQEVEEELEKYKAFLAENNPYDLDILEQLTITNPNNIDYNSSESIKKEFLIGTPKQIKHQLNEFIKKGVSHFMLWFMDYPSTKGIELFSKKIIKNSI